MGERIDTVQMPEVRSYTHKTSFVAFKKERVGSKKPKVQLTHCGKCNEWHYYYLPMSHKSFENKQCL